MEKAAEKKKGFVKEFMDFLQTFGIIGLAIAFIIGAAASAVVNALVKDLINPLVGIFLPSGNLSSLNATVSRLLLIQTAQASRLRKDLVSNPPSPLRYRGG
jgi:large conductance mechanosensitive channel